MSNDSMRVAHRDIIVYKVMFETRSTPYTGMIQSPYMGTYYKIGEMYRNPFHPFRDLPTLILKQWKNAKGLVYDAESVQSKRQKHRYCVERGYHSFRLKRDAMELCNAFECYDYAGKHPFVYRCVIPKGAYYYAGQCDIGSIEEDLRGSYCSNSIQVICKIS